MRYREELGNTPPPDAEHPSQKVVDFTVGFTLIIGIVFVVAGLQGRQMWLRVWGTLTIVASVVYYARGWLFSI